MWANFVISLICVAAQAAQLHVPDEYPSIQQALNSCVRSDTILIAAGRYQESLIVPDFWVTIAGNYTLSHDTNEVESTTIVAPLGQYSVTAPDNSFADSLTIEGLRFVGNSYSSVVQTGGISSTNRALFVSNCIFDTCCGTDGGVLQIVGGTAIVTATKYYNCHGGTGSIVSLAHSICSVSKVMISNCESNGPVFRLTACDFSLDSVKVCQVGSVTLPTLFGILGNASIQIKNSAFRLSRFFAGFHATLNTCVVNLACDSSVFDSLSSGLSFLELDSFWGEGSTITFRHNVFASMFVIEDYGGTFLLAVGTHGQISGQITGNIFVRNHRRQTSAVVARYGAPFLIDRNYFIENTSEGWLSDPGGVTLLTGNGASTFNENIFINNQHLAVDHFGQFDPGHAEHNYWGHPSGPYNSWSNPEGLGDSVDTLIFYEPWEQDTLFLEVPNHPTHPITFALGYPYPNPFNSTITIEYALTNEQRVLLEIYDVLGRKVETLFDETQPIGVHQVLWDAESQASGIYFARLSSPDSRLATQAVKLLLMK